MPRRFGVFDYTCDASVQAGDLVWIPLRGRSVLGVVRVVKSTAGTTKRLSAIERVMLNKFFTPDDITRIESIATDIVQSPSTLFFQALMGISKEPSKYITPTTTQKASISKDIVEQIKTFTEEKASFIQGSIETCIALAYQYASKLDGQMIIVAPHEKDAHSIASLLPKNKRVATLHGKIPHNQRSSIIRSWRNGEIDILVGTKQATLLPANNLSVGILYNPTHHDHVSYDRNPRFDAKVALTLLCVQHKAEQISCGPTPQIQIEPTPAVYAKTDIKVIDLSAQDEKTGIPFLSETLKQAIDGAHNDNKQAIVLYNRKGYAARLRCKDCGHVPFCGSCGGIPKMRKDDLACPVCHTEMWIPEKCPSCNGANLKPRGIGNNRLREKWQEAFPGKTIATVDKKDHAILNADILLVTEYFFSTIHSAFMRYNVGVVADACSDLHMDNTADAGLQMASRIHRLSMFAKMQKVNPIVQTWTPTLIKPMVNLQRFYTQERDTRQTYNLPPFKKHIKITCKKEIPEELVALRTYAEADEEIDLYEINSGLELLTSVEKYGKLLPYLQQLPDHCILQITL
ncbi:hypothetical protein HON52_04215 [Candidatus Uhrbacteria bacterium]|nr:hypothetical protein [Candidatus Uhrbacteria bacterium]